MRTKVFCHKGIIGIESDFKAEGLFNDPLQRGQLGFVIDANYVDIHPEALELLKQIPKSHDDIGDVDVYKADDDTVIFAWIGGSKAILNPMSNISGSSSYDPSLLKPNPEVETPDEFIKFIEAARLTDEV